MVKNLPTKQEMRVQSLSQEDPLEQEVATHSSSLAWRISWTKEPGRLHSSWDRKGLETTLGLNHHTSTLPVLNTTFVG